MPRKNRTRRSRNNNSTTGVPRAANALQQRFGCWVGIENELAHTPADGAFTMDISAQYALGFKVRFGQAWKNFRMTAYEGQLFAAPKVPDGQATFPNYPIYTSQYDVSAKDWQTPGGFVLPTTVSAMAEMPNIKLLSVSGANVRSVRKFSWRCKDLQNLPFQDIAVNDPSQPLFPIWNNVGILGFTDPAIFSEVFVIRFVGRIWVEFKDVGIFNPSTVEIPEDTSSLKDVYDIVTSTDRVQNNTARSTRPPVPAWRNPATANRK